MTSVTRERTMSAERKSSAPEDRSFLPWPSTDVTSRQGPPTGLADGYFVDWQMSEGSPSGLVVGTTPEL